MSWVTGVWARVLVLRAAIRAWLGGGGSTWSARRRPREAGIELITWIVLLSIMVAIAIAAGAIIKTKVLDTANNTPTQ